MLHDGLKLWSTNKEWFPEAVDLCAKKIFDVIELHHNPVFGAAEDVKQALRGAPVIGIHNPHSHGFHDFFLEEHQKPIWEATRMLADHFHVRYILVHPARTHNMQTFFEQMKKIEDPRIVIENMAGVDIDHQEMQCGQTLSDLRAIKEKYPICFDLEKAVKAARNQGIDYHEFILEGINDLAPMYFHISGGDAESAMDQHLNLWDATFDISWMRKILVEYAKDKEVFLMFETPKVGGSLENDVKNLVYFRGE